MVCPNDLQSPVRRVYSTGLIPRTNRASSNDSLRRSGIGSRRNLAQSSRRRGIDIIFVGEHSSVSMICADLEQMSLTHVHGVGISYGSDVEFVR